VIIFSLILMTGQAPDNSGYFFIDRTCVAQNDGYDPIFWGLGKGECQDVADADKALNLAYRRSLSQINETRRRQLRDQQRRWINATVATCELDVDGTVRVPEAASCYIDEANRRTLQLRRMRLN
jgi:uncharacterized protein YecT (DUF1311 family)